MRLMSPEELRRRLEELNRGPLPDAGWTPPPGRTVSADRPEIVPSEHEPPEAGATGLERLIRGREMTVGSGRCYGISRRLSQCWSPEPQIAQRLASTIEAAASRSDALDADLAPAVRAGADALLFMDTETCGFAGTPVFLIGVMFRSGGDLHVEQMLARNYEEEPAIVARYADLSRSRPVLVTFNGKSFDWPFLRDRAAVARLELDDPPVHCDLLHAARRRYRHLLPDCRLQTLETYVCGRRRLGDIPGGDIPRAYHGFVRTGDARELQAIVHHNFLDLVTLADMLADLLGP
jgi:uncharacterized protein YprB with RNaseH-like and TPR domain